MAKQARQCTYQIDGPPIDARGNVAWRRQCRIKTTHSSGRCRFHPTAYDERQRWYPGERTVDRQYRQEAAAERQAQADYRHRL